MAGKILLSTVAINLFVDNILEISGSCGRGRGGGFLIKIKLILNYLTIRLDKTFLIIIFWNNWRRRFRMFIECYETDGEDIFNTIISTASCEEGFFNPRIILSPTPGLEDLFELNLSIN